MRKLKVQSHCLLLVALLIGPAKFSACGGIKLTTLVSFNGTNGVDPLALVQAADGSFYGTALLGGSGFNGTWGSGDGTIFRLASEGVLTNWDWARPASLIQGTDGNLYGTTYTSFGAIFRRTSNGTITNIYTFNGFWSNGVNPVKLVHGRDGYLYGVTQFGGAYPFGGTIFKMSTEGDKSILATFNLTNGSEPVSLIQAADDNFYGTTFFYGAASSGYGSVFKMTPAGVVNSLMTFNGTNGSGPGWLVQGADGNFYGTTSSGGIGFDGSANSGYGTFFKLTPDGTIAWSFLFNGTNGVQPIFFLRGADGSFYGTTPAGGIGFTNSIYQGFGTIFKITPDGRFTNLVLCDSTNAPIPLFLVQATDGNLYGTSKSGGTNGFGAIFRLSVPMVPTFRAMTQTNGVLAFTWSSVAGQLYQVQYSSNLNSTNWSDLGGAFVATDGMTTNFDTIDVNSRRYYRIMMFP